MSSCLIIERHLWFLSYGAIIDSGSVQAAEGGAMEQPVKQPAAALINKVSKGGRAQDARALTSWTPGLVWTSLPWRCCSREDTSLSRLRFSFSVICLSRADCTLSTWTPVMSSGKAGSRGLSSVCPSPCTSKSIRIKSCKCSLCCYLITHRIAQFW